MRTSHLRAPVGTVLTDAGADGMMPWRGVQRLGVGAAAAWKWMMRAFNWRAWHAYAGSYDMYSKRQGLSARLAVGRGATHAVQTRECLNNERRYLVTGATCDCSL